MIDIHSHALYECDDGSKNIEQSINMIKAASEAGITGMFLTPHYMDDGYKNDKSSICEKIEIIKQKLIEQKIDVKLYKGEEVFIYPNLDDEIDEKCICLNDSRYILIELPLVESVNYLEDVIYRVLSKEKVPIIAHPERYLATEKDFSFVQSLIDKGALIQVNANSLVGHYGKSAKNIAIKLLKNNMVHFVASDAHSENGYKILPESLSCIKKLVGEEKFNEITLLNQQKVVQNEEIIIEKVNTKHRCKFLRFFMKGW